jgi:hypothetical protein
MSKKNKVLQTGSLLDAFTFIRCSIFFSDKAALLPAAQAVVHYVTTSGQEQIAHNNKHT